MVEIPYEGPRFSGTKASVSATSRIAELEQRIAELEAEHVKDLIFNKELWDRNCKLEQQVAELEKKLHGTVTTKYHDKIVAEAMQRVAELEAENAKLREERKVLLATLVIVRSDRDAWQAAHNALRESK